MNINVNYILCMIIVYEIVHSISYLTTQSRTILWAESLQLHLKKDFQKKRKVFGEKKIKII